MGTADRRTKTDRPKEPMIRFFKCLMWGFISILLLGSPVIFAWIAYKLILVGVSDPLLRGRIAILTGYVSLVLGPLYVLGASLQKSREPEVPWSRNHAAANRLKYSEIIDIWKTCVDVQKHFNDIELQIRNYAVTLMVAVIGASAYALKENMTVIVWGFKYSLAIAVLPAGMLGWLAFYFMDRHWYHRLLMGSVKDTVRVEAMLNPELDLSGAIGKESAIPINWPKTDYMRIHSSEKIDIFYFAGLMLFIMMTGITLMGATNATTVQAPAPITMQRSPASGSSPGAMTTESPKTAPSSNEKKP